MTLPASPASLLAINFAVAALYLCSSLAAAALTGPVNGLLAISPGAGVALVAALVGGWRWMPGVLVGFVAFALLNFGQSSAAAALVSPVGIALTACAVVAQALIGVAISRRWRGATVDDDQPWNENTVLACGALAIGISALVRALLIAQDASLDVEPWLVFVAAWAAGAAGVLLVAPLLLAVLFRHHRLWQQRLRNTLFPAGVALLAVIAISTQINAHEKRRLNDAFAREVYEIDVEMQRQFTVYRRVGLSINRLWQSSDEVTRDEFRRFVTPLLVEMPALQALEWLPVVQHEDRAELEADARADGLTGFAFRQRNSEGFIAATLREDYLPVYFLEPIAGNELVLGFDMRSLPDRGAFLNTAAQRRAPTGSPPLTLLQDKRQHNGLLITLPVYAADNTALRGFVVSVFHIDEMLLDSAQRATRAGVTFTVTDNTGGNTVPVFAHGATPAQKPSREKMPALTREFDFGGRDWHIDYSATRAWMAKQGSLRGWLTLIGGSLLVGLLQTLLLGMSGNSARTAREVALRTLELRQLAELNEALQGAATLDEAHELMARHLPAVFGGCHGGVLVAQGGGQQPLVEWAGDRVSATPTATPTTTRIEIPLTSRGEQLGLLWLESPSHLARAQANSEGYLSERHIRDVAQSLMLALGNLRLREALRDQAIRDTLTGLYNRRHLGDVFPALLATAQRQGTSFCVALIDIDHFKRVNDTYGHDAGDRVLQALAQFTRDTLRVSDYCFRLGGEEFALLLPNTALADGITCVDNLRAGFATQAFHFGEHPVYRPTFSAGVVEAPAGGVTLDALLHAADEALYRAKNAGRNCVLPAHTGETSP